MTRSLPARSSFLARSCALVLTALVPALSGCSFLFVEGPPEGHERMAYFDCTSSNLAPIVDTTFAVTYGAAALLYASDTRTHSYSRSPAVPTITMAAIAAIDTASAVHGFSKTKQCRRAKSELNARLLSRPPIGCGRDSDCKGDRVCESGLCVAPRAEQAPVPAFPVESAPPPQNDAPSPAPP